MQPVNPYQVKELSTEKQPIKFNATYVKSGFVKPTNTDLFNKDYENEIKTNGLQPTYKKYGYEADKELTMKKGGSLREYKYLKKGGQVKKAQGGIELSDDKYSSGNEGQVAQIGKSGIHIKKENIGKFTKTKKVTGKSTEELTHSKNPLTRKRAIFAQNAKKWKHESGGKVTDNMPVGLTLQKLFNLDKLNNKK